MIRLQTVISNADFYVLNTDENCQMRWQKKERGYLKSSSKFRVWPYL